MSRPGTVRNWWHMRKWKRSPRCTDGEIAVLRSLLPANDHRSELLLMQAKDAPEVHRCLLDVSSYKLTIPYVKDEAYGIDVREDLVCPPLSIVDTISGRTLSFTVRVLCGGALNDLVGTAADGLPWPLEWEVTEAELAKALKDRPMDWLPSMMTAGERLSALRRLAAWCGMNVVELCCYRASLLEIRDPASPTDISSAEARLGMELPIAYRELLAISDGVTIRHGRPYNIFGTADIYAVDFAGEAFLVLTDLYEAGVVAIDVKAAPDGSVVLLTRESDQRKVIGSLQVHVRDSLRWLAEIEPQEGIRPSP